MDQSPTFSWGHQETELFLNLLPERILEAVEMSTEFTCTGRTFQLNSMENRVHEIEINLDEKPKYRSESFVISKFYRPGRWTLEQIQDEHDFLNELIENEIPVIAPLKLNAGKTIHKLKSYNICLLYTSPRPRDRQKSRMPSSA